MALDIRTILDAVESHALASGFFQAVNGHEPKSAPQNGLTAAVWVEQIGPARGGAGLSSTSARLALFVRLYTPATSRSAAWSATSTSSAPTATRSAHAPAT